MDYKVSDSILKSIRNSRGVADNGEAFDQELIPLINTYLMVLDQIGIGQDGFAIHGEEETWSDFLGSDTTSFEAVRTYVDTRVRLGFDPPISTHITKLLEDTYKELEWRLRIKVENPLNKG